MSASPAPAVCRDIDVTVLQKKFWNTAPEPVLPEPIPDDRRPLAEYLAGLLPGSAPEHLSRESMLRMHTPSNEMFEMLHKYRPDKSLRANPSSLFFQAVHTAFEKHHPLALSPEVLHFLMLREVAVTVRMYPQEYDTLFRAEQRRGRELISVRHDGLYPGDPLSPWGEAIALYEEPLRQLVPGGLLDRCLPGFSTETPESRLALLIAFMDAASPYYRYEMCTLCGIPKIRLLGTPADWRLLRESGEALAERFSVHLGRYFRHLLPVLRTLEEQAAGTPADNDFWMSAYKFQSSSGDAGDECNGWLSMFVEYVHDRVDGEEALVRKPDAIADWTACGQGERMRGIKADSIPAHVSTVPFLWRVSGQELPMIFAGGVLGVENLDGFLAPILSYAVLHKGERPA